MPPQAVFGSLGALRLEIGRTLASQVQGRMAHATLLPRRPLAVIFDMDGLLFDTEALYQRAIAGAARMGGHELGDSAAMMIGRPHDHSRLLLIERHGDDFPVDAFMAAMVEQFERLAATELELKPGVHELLDTLDQLALPRAIATSSAHETVQHHLVD